MKCRQLTSNVYISFFDVWSIEIELKYFNDWDFIYSVHFDVNFGTLSIFRNLNFSGLEYNFFFQKKRRTFHVPIMEIKRIQRVLCFNLMNLMMKQQLKRKDTNRNILLCTSVYWICILITAPKSQSIVFASELLCLIQFKWICRASRFISIILIILYFVSQTQFKMCHQCVTSIKLYIQCNIHLFTAIQSRPNNVT